MPKPNPVVHFEMGYNDRERIKKFYEGVFGWQTQQFGAEMGNYVVARTGESDESSGWPIKPGYINGGFYQKIADPLSHAPSIVIAVDDIRQAMKDVVAAGGKILGSMGSDGKHNDEPQMIPGVGLWISAMDTEENRFSLLQPKGM